jgi:hypothetical protein
MQSIPVSGPSITQKEIDYVTDAELMLGMEMLIFITKNSSDRSLIILVSNMLLLYLLVPQLFIYRY